MQKSTPPCRTVASIVKKLDAQNKKIQGCVICQFIVGQDDTIENAKVVHSVSPNLDEEAMRVTRSMPNRIPKKQDEPTVRVKYTLPITFRLSSFISPNCVEIKKGENNKK